MIISCFFLLGMMQFEPNMAFAAGEINPDLLLPRVQYKENTSGQPTKLSYVNQLPKGTWQEVLTSVIKFILMIAGTLTFVSFTVSGVMMVVARGEDEALGKAKNMILWSIVALAVIAASYAIVTGISQLDFFSGNLGSSGTSSTVSTSTP